MRTSRQKKNKELSCIITLSQWSETAFKERPLYCHTRMDDDSWNLEYQTLSRDLT